MGKIVELAKEVVEQIAAGEVVENPASIVKELVENSIDAGASKIFVEIENGGKSLIRISDDGVGMSREDTILSIKRHATSKIGQLTDLFDIHSLGFRGEALAAISSVTNFELITKPEFEVEGTRLSLDEDGNPKTESVACPKGSTIVCRNLFYNTPARKKYLRPASFESSKVLEIATKYAISNPLIYFKVTHDGKVMLNSPNTASQLNNIVDVYGKDIAKQLLEVDYKDDIYTIKGYISKPSFSRSDKDLINIFVNKRYVKNKTITDAVYDSYHTLLHQHRYPFSLLHISVDPKRLDVNVHPAKTKIKVEQESRLYEVIFDLVRDTLKNNDIISEPVPEGYENQQNLSVENNSSLNVQNEATSNQDNEPDRKYAVNPAEQVVLTNDTTSNETIPTRKPMSIDTASARKIEASEEVFPKYNSTNPVTILGDDDAVISDISNKQDIKPDYSGITETVLDEKTFEQREVINTERETGKAMKVLGQVYKTYVMIETKKGLTILDQHAAHERVLFDKLLNESRNMTFGKQELLSPVKVTLGIRETSIIEENRAFLKQVGFELENFGGGTYLMRTVPIVFKRKLDDTHLLDLITDILNHGKVNTLDKMKHEIISTMACKAAIKAGDELTREQMKDLVYEFFSLDMSYTCPHGRPIVIEVPIEELEKRFKRTGF